MATAGGGARGLSLPRGVLTRDHRRHGPRRPPAREAAVGAPQALTSLRPRTAASLWMLSYSQPTPRCTSVLMAEQRRAIGMQVGQVAEPAAVAESPGQCRGLYPVRSSLTAEM